MPNPPKREATLGIVLERIDQLGNIIGSLVGKLESLARSVQEFQLTYTAEHIKVVESTAQAHRRIDGVDTKMKELEECVEAQKLILNTMKEQVRQMRNILVALSAILAPLIVGLLWEILTHRITIITP